MGSCRIRIYVSARPVCACTRVCAGATKSVHTYTYIDIDVDVNQSIVLTKPHTGKEKPWHTSTTTEGSNLCY